MQKMCLGLFGAGIGRSQAPKLHRLAGQLCGLEIRYELFDLNKIGLNTFPQALKKVIEQGYQGVNITHPVKETTAHLVSVPNPTIQQIGAVNTVRLTDKTGYNTDYSGFIKAFQNRFGRSSPGEVLMVGAGGVGKAIAFALKHLDSNTTLHLVDSHRSKAENLAHDLNGIGLQTHVYDVHELAEIAAVDGLINCTPLGMYQYPGSALPSNIIGGQQWAFDAVYTPLETTFLRDAKAAGLDVLSGYELFFYQGLDAFEIFTGKGVDETRLRQVLIETS